MPGSVLLTSTTNSFEAKVIAARLHSEGLHAELRGAVDGPYPFLIGGMGEVGVWVREDQLDDARLVMIATEVDNAVGGSRSAPPQRTGLARLAVGIVLVSLVAVYVVRAVGLL